MGKLDYAREQKIPIECPDSLDEKHVWARRRDGKICIYCECRQFGSSDLTNVEKLRIQLVRQGSL